MTSRRPHRHTHTHIQRERPRYATTSVAIGRIYTRCFVVLRQLRSIHVPDTYCVVGTVEAGLRKCRLGRSSCVPVQASSVGNERGRTAHLPPASLRPHLRRTHQPPLAPGSGESTVQDGRAHVQGHSWNCAVIPESTGSCRRSAWSTFPPLCSDQSSAGAIRETVYRWRPGLPGRRTHHLEQPTGKRDISQPSVNLPSAFKNISVPGFIP